MIKRATALALLAAIALLGAGCGKDNPKGSPIATSLASRLEQRLQVIQSQYNKGGGACTDIVDKTRPVVESDLAQIPNSVDPAVRNALRQSFNHLFDLSTTQCQGTTTTQTTPTQTDTTPTQTQQTQTQQTQTQQTQTQQLPPGQQKKQKKQKNDNGGGAAAPGNGQ